MESENKDLLIKGLKKLNISFNDDVIQKIDSFIMLYTEWNRNINISAIRGEKEIIIRHVLDSLTPISFLKSMGLWNYNAKYIDLGTGGGLPGIMLKIIDSKLPIDLGEVSKKKICFLKEVILHLSLSNVEIIDSSVAKVKEVYHYVFVRAFGSLQKIVQESGIYINKGKIIAYKGKKEKVIQELEGLSPTLKQHLIVQRIKVPFLDEERHLVIIQS
ncbi:MAG TPA: 16S rRNA (guanine(527)-N(7))-methyltransferase RsmG [Spirochaetes bacterium]|nr:16S rRNA (guanine(527)-N(7))-methyltransferase RsmG [Spirochaetota bacterium]